MIIAVFDQRFGIEQPLKRSCPSKNSPLLAQRDAPQFSRRRPPVVVIRSAVRISAALAAEPETHSGGHGPHSNILKRNLKRLARGLSACLVLLRSRQRQHQFCYLDER